MLFFSHILALLAIVSPVSAQGFDKTCEFAGIEPYFDSYSHITYRCSSGKGKKKKFSKLDLNHCIGPHMEMGILTWINSVPYTHAGDYAPYSNNCHDCEYDRSNTYLNCQCTDGQGRDGVRSGVYLRDRISNWGGDLHGNDGLPQNCVSEETNC